MPCQESWHSYSQKSFLKREKNVYSIINASHFRKRAAKTEQARNTVLHLRECKNQWWMQRCGSDNLSGNDPNRKHYFILVLIARRCFLHDGSEKLRLRGKTHIEKVQGQERLSHSAKNEQQLGTMGQTVPAGLVRERLQVLLHERLVQRGGTSLFRSALKSRKRIFNDF